MTQQRDLKRRIRERQTKTGESYMTARGHVLAQRPTNPIAVVEPLDATEAAARLGLRCRVLIFPKLAEAFDTERLLERVRDALLVCEAEPLKGLGLHGRIEPMPGRWAVDRAGAQGFRDRARAGIGGASKSGFDLAMHVDGVPVVCTAWNTHPVQAPVLVLMALEEQGVNAWGM